MDKLKQNKTIAKILGWQVDWRDGLNQMVRGGFAYPNRFCAERVECWFIEGNDKYPGVYCSPPNYSGDVNLMVDACKFLPEDKFIIFIDNLALITEAYYKEKGDKWIRLINASAAQRAEAFLRTHNLWKIE